jgi:hypothetical protein
MFRIGPTRGEGLGSRATLVATAADKVPYEADDDKDEDAAADGSCKEDDGRSREALYEVIP